MTACSSLATAGDVMLGQNGSVELLAKSGTSLTCSQVNCTGEARRVYRLQSLTEAQEIVTTEPLGISSKLSTIFAPSRGFGGQNVYALSSLDPLAPNAAAVSSTGASSQDSSTTFIISDGTIIQRFESGWADVTSGDSVGGTGNAYTSSSINLPASSFATDLQFSDPIVSPLFNLASTTIVVNPPAAQPAEENRTPSTKNVESFVESLMATPPVERMVVPTLMRANAEAATNHPDMADPTTAVDGSGGGAKFTAAASVASNMNAPEPSTELLIGAGLIAAGVFARVKRQQSKR